MSQVKRFNRRQVQNRFFFRGSRWSLAVLVWAGALVIVSGCTGKKESPPEVKVDTSPVVPKAPQVPNPSGIDFSSLHLGERSPTLMILGGAYLEDASKLRPEVEVTLTNGKLEDGGSGVGSAPILNPGTATEKKGSKSLQTVLSLGCSDAVIGNVRGKLGLPSSVEVKSGEKFSDFPFSISEVTKADSPSSTGAVKSKSLTLQVDVLLLCGMGSDQLKGAVRKKLKDIGESEFESFSIGVTVLVTSNAFMDFDGDQDFKSLHVVSQRHIVDRVNHVSFVNSPSKTNRLPSVKFALFNTDTLELATPDSKFKIHSKGSDFAN